MVLYRVVHRRYSEGSLYASGLAGRFNSDGKKVVYTTGSISLAFLENMVHRNGTGFHENFRTLIIYVPDELDVTALLKKDLPKDWNKDHSYYHTQPIGDKWFDEGITPILKVPSAVVPQEFNYILNSQHSDFKKINVIDRVPLFADNRLDDIIEKYGKTKM